MNKRKLKSALKKATGCTVQDGWTCGTCFYSIGKSLTNQDWQALLLYRGTGYKEEDMDNLPEDREASLQKILELATKTN